jgi:hypothetical protein
MNNLTWPISRMAKLIDATPRRLQQFVQEGVMPKCEGRGRYNPFAVNVAYIRFLRDRAQSPELSDSEFFQAKLAKLKSEREKIDLENRILRSEMIPIEDALTATNLVFGAISGILKANRDKILTIDQINEIFAEMREVAKWLQQKANGASASLDLSSASALNRPTLRTP